MTPTMMITASGTIWLSSYASRSCEKLSRARSSLGLPLVPNQPTPNPGQISATVASSAQKVGTTEHSQAPAVPQGTRYGRSTSGRDRRSLIRAGKMNRYEVVVVEIVRPRTAAKYLLALPPVILKASTMSTVATVPDSRFIATGVPNRLENRPRALVPPVTCPPYTVNTALAASRNPVSPVT